MNTKLFERFKKQNASALYVKTELSDKEQKINRDYNEDDYKQMQEQEYKEIEKLSINDNLMTKFTKQIFIKINELIDAVNDHTKAIDDIKKHIRTW